MLPPLVVIFFYFFKNKLDKRAESLYNGLNDYLKETNYGNQMALYHK